MPQERETIRCDEHGEAYATYVCEHLAARPKQAWFGGYPEEGEPWPDAWCALCNAIYLREGAWNERNADEIRAKLICDRCYAAGRAASVGALGKAKRARWDDFVAACCRELEAKQARLDDDFAMTHHQRWDWDQATGRLTFSNDGVPALLASIEFVGSVSSVSHTWLWAWANFSLAENVRRRIVKVRELGEREGFPHLTAWKWDADEHDGWHMAAIAAHVLGAAGVYRAPTEKGAAFLALMTVEEA